MSYSLTPYGSLFDDSNDWLIHDPFRNQVFKNVKNHNGQDLTKAISPLLAMDIIETEKEYKIHADLPGVDPADLELTVENNSILMKAERKSEHETTTDTVHRLERSYGSVSRRLLLPKNADMSQAETRFVNGVLTVTVPKHAEVPATSRKLAINTTA
jgi:HSP20 family protein